MTDPLDLAQSVPPELITPATMGLIDRATIARGMPGIDLMTNAGKAVSQAIFERFAPAPTIVLCGPGNNGGDGYIVAQDLREAGWPVRLMSLIRSSKLSGDAAIAASRWQGDFEDPDLESVGQAGIVVDGLFGAGLARPLDGTAAQLANAASAGSAKIVAIDVPSGVDGANGQLAGPTFGADLTVTFCRLKPGHVLEPGRSRCGEILCADIGIPGSIVARHDDGLSVNSPSLWQSDLPVLRPQGHKYSHGHAIVLGGAAASTGAAILAARAALRSGAGLVSVACDEEALPIYASQLRAEMTKPIVRLADLDRLIGDPRVTALIAGPGLGICPRTLRRLELLIESGKPLLLDADALTCLAGDTPIKLHHQCVLTPHGGEFARLFGATSDKLNDTRKAASQSGAIVVHKGRDTVIAAPDGHASINVNAPPQLATAGSGDVLAGVIGGLMAQGMPVDQAAKAGVYLHADAARRHGPGLVASTLDEHVAAALADVALAN